MTLNLHKNRDINDDEVGLKLLADCLKDNSFLQTIDLTSIMISKPILRNHFLPALENNIFLQRIIGRVPPGIITDEISNNVTIDEELVRCLEKEPINQSVSLNLKHKKPELLRPALKLVKC